MLEVILWQQHSQILEYNKMQRFVNFSTFLCSLGIYFSVKKYAIYYTSFQPSIVIST